MAVTLLDEARFAGTMDGVSHAAVWLRESAARHQLSDKLAFALEVCLEELGTNVTRHGRIDGQSSTDASADPLTIDLSLVRDGSDIELILTDNSRPFDVSQAHGAPIRKPLAEVIPGGLGIQLVRSFSDELLYEPIAGGNRVIVRFLRQLAEATRARA